MLEFQKQAIWPEIFSMQETSHSPIQTNYKIFISHQEKPYKTLKSHYSLCVMSTQGTFSGSLPQIPWKEGEMAEEERKRRTERGDLLNIGYPSVITRKTRSFQVEQIMLFVLLSVCLSHRIQHEKKWSLVCHSQKKISSIYQIHLKDSS